LYSWDNTGKKLLYGDYDENIYMYDMESKEEKKILEGRHPFTQTAMNICIYGKDQKLTVYNVNTGENWRTVTIGSSTRYIFSPDDKYILLGRNIGT